MLEKPRLAESKGLLRTGAIAFAVGIIIYFISTSLHPSREDPSDNLHVFAEYAASDSWIAVHFGQYLGAMLIAVGGFTVVFRSLTLAESGRAVTIAWLGFAIMIMMATTFSILQAVDGITLKRMVDRWVAAPEEGKTTAFRIAEAVRWVEIGINSVFGILEGLLFAVFGFAIALSRTYPKWIGLVGIVGGLGLIPASIDTAYLGFAETAQRFGILTYVSYTFLIILAAYLWRRSMKLSKITV